MPIKPLTVNIINLDHSLDRLKNITEQCEKQKIPFKRFKAVSGEYRNLSEKERFCLKNVDFINKTELFKENSNFRCGTLGCLLSHLSLIKQSQANPYTLISEDDQIIIDEDFNETVGKLISLLDSNPQINLLHLGGIKQQLGCKNPKAVENIVVSEKYDIALTKGFWKCQGNQMYIITSKGCEIILDKFQKGQCLCAVDHFMNTNCASSVVRPPMAIHGEFTSTRAEQRLQLPPKAVPGEFESTRIRKQKIFVSIASFRDVQLMDTLKSLLENAQSPDRLIFGICLQETPENLQRYKTLLTSTQYKVLYINHKDSRGCCWARAKVQTLITDEDFYLQLDSHHRMVKHWDLKCEDMLKNIIPRSTEKKAVLSSYLTCADTDLKLSGEKYEGWRISHGNHPMRMNCDKFYENFPKVLYRPEAIPDYKNLEEPQAWKSIGAHFIFTTIEWAKEIPYDSDLYFEGEEDTLSVRSWTNGWDIFYPHVVIGYHYYLRKQESKHYDSHEDWWKIDRVSKEKLKKIWRGEELSIYGLGEKRTLEAYKKEWKIDYLNGKITTGALSVVSEDVEKPLSIVYEDGSILEKRPNSLMEQPNNLTYQKIEENEKEWIFKDSLRNLNLKLQKHNFDVWLQWEKVDWFKFKGPGKILKIHTADLLKPVITPGKNRIAIITLGTSNLQEMLIHSRKNQKFYAQKHGYHFIEYNDTLIESSIVTWNKVYVLDRHLSDFDWILWIDADAVFANLEITLESIINNRQGDYHLLACDDIGGWRLNSGVLFFKNSEWSKNLIAAWKSMKHLTHDKGAEQAQLIELLKDKQCFKIFPRKCFNQHPKEFLEGDFILHMMGMSNTERIKRFIAINNLLF
jgi:GR25 family glycosyltransferase involved in LPS biosynthesis